MFALSILGLRPVFAFSILFKLLTWHFSLKVGDTGQPTRPWILSAVIAGVFAVFDCFSDHRKFTAKLMISAAYLLSAVVMMHVYYRTQRVMMSLFVIAVGTAVFFLGVPFSPLWSSTNRT